MEPGNKIFTKCLQYEMSLLLILTQSILAELCMIMIMDDLEEPTVCASSHPIPIDTGWHY